MLSLLNQRWVLAEPAAELTDCLVRELGVSPTLAKLLINRDIHSLDEARFFLEADLANLHDPFLMLGMETAVERIVRAIDSGEKVVVFGDYDVDGVTSASLLVHFFRELNIPFDYYLPERMAEGYGLNKSALDKIKSEGSSLVITADCGITAVDEVRHAKEIGLDVIVSDHHQVGEEGLPSAVAVLNPHQPGCGYPFRFLSGVGIVFKLAAGVRSTLHKAGWDKQKLPNLKKHLDLFSLGTIADLAPLTGENHVLSRHGLEAMRTTAKPGLVALKSVAGLNSAVDSKGVGFGLGPRLNAAGRLGKADAGLHLLTCPDMKEAMQMAEDLDKTNDERKEIQKWTLEEAEYMAAREFDSDQDRVIVLASENFHQGVIGIVASKLVDKYYRPAILIALKDGMGKGSARSIPTFNVHKAMTECSRYMVQFGGHAYAAGLNIEEGRIDEFRKAINEVGQRILTADKLVADVNIDSVLELKEVSWGLYNEVQIMAPFGRGNPTPVFLSKAVVFSGLRSMGKEKNHARFKVRQGNASFEVVAFTMYEALRNLSVEEPVDIVYEINRNDWNGREKLELRLIDIH